jgi:hypothetical protein
MINILSFHDQENCDPRVLNFIEQVKGLRLPLFKQKKT